MQIFVNMQKVEITGTVALECEMMVVRLVRELQKCSQALCDVEDLMLWAFPTLLLQRWDVCNILNTARAYLMSGHVLPAAEKLISCPILFQCTYSENRGTA